MREKAAKRVALQFPEGLLVYSCLIADILEEYVVPAIAALLSPMLSAVTQIHRRRDRRDGRRHLWCMLH